MAKWAVAFVSMYDNELTVEIHEAETWKKALAQHSKVQEHGSEKAEMWLDTLVDEPMSQAQDEAYDGEILFDVVEVK